MTARPPWWPLLLALVATPGCPLPEAGAAENLRIAAFSADVTVPVGHRCMGILPVRAREVVDPLEARGFVLLGAGTPVVLVSIDWCEIRNDAHDAWRDALAEAAGTRRDRVLVTTVHQHDAPVADLTAERLLQEAGLPPGTLMDLEFHRAAIERVRDALRASLARAQAVTHLGIAATRVEHVASNRRVEREDGSVDFSRGSASAGDPALAGAPEGLIDPWLRTVSFWNGPRPLVALHVYATHPMSRYGHGRVSADFPGVARRRLQEKDPDLPQIYISGCSGDVTAGKYNDGGEGSREVLGERLYVAMESWWDRTRRHPLTRAELRVVPLDLPFRREPGFTAAALRARLDDPDAPERERILAALGLSSRLRVDAGRSIDLACLDLGRVQLLIFPGETFVGFQLLAQRLRPDAFVVCAGYGEGWPGYIPTRAAEKEGFESDWMWVGPGAAKTLQATVRSALTSPRVPGAGPDLSFSRDVYEASGSNPRYSEGSVLRLRDESLVYATTEFVGGGSDHSTARIIARASTDGGRTWSAPRILERDVGKLNVMSVTLRRLRTPGLSDIGVFYLVKNSLDDLRVQLRISTDELDSLGGPIAVSPDPGYHVMNNDRVTLLTDGRILCPVAWTRDVRSENHFVSFCYLSDDAGRSWRRGRGEVDLPRRGAMEPGVMELRGGELLMILRTQLGEIWASRSADRGESWSEPRAWGVPSPESPATLRRVPSTGDLLLVWNPNPVAGADHGGKRTPLAAAISRDEGLTWAPPRLVESLPDQTYAYTSATFVPDRVLLTYYVRDDATGWISSRFRSLPTAWFYEAP